MFCVHAGTMEDISRFRQENEAIANDLGLVSKDHPKANTPQLVPDWLNSEDRGNRLLIFSTIDDQAIFKSRPQDSF